MEKKEEEEFGREKKRARRGGGKKKKQNKTRIMTNQDRIAWVQNQNRHTGCFNQRRTHKMDMAGDDKKQKEYKQK